MKNQIQNKPLKFLLFAGGLYFLSVALVHVLGVKVPGLFVYFNVPSYAYQDRIISFLALGWAGIFYLAAKKMDTDMIKLILIIGLIAIFALLVNTLITDFRQLDADIVPASFLMITLGLFAYWLSLVILSKNLWFQRKG